MSFGVAQTILIAREPPKCKTAFENVQKDVQKQLSARQRVLLAMIEAEPSVTMAEMSRKTGVSTKTIQRDLAAMNIARVGGRRDGYWKK